MKQFAKAIDQKSPGMISPKTEKMIKKQLGH